MRTESTMRACALAGIVLAMLMAVVFISGCTQQAQDGEGPLIEPNPAEQPVPDEGTEAEGEAIDGAIEPAEEAGDEAAEPADEESGAEEDEDVADATTVTIETDRGTMTAELYTEKAPITAGSFLLLAEDGFYDGLTFHRVEPQFVIQGGDPAGNGSGGPGFSIPLETSPELTHERGALSMARASDPDSAGSQFFVCLTRERCAPLDGQYAVFGQVTEGVEVADEIEVGDTIESVEVVSEGPHAEEAREAARDARVPD